MIPISTMETTVVIRRKMNNITKNEHNSPNVDTINAHAKHNYNVNIHTIPCTLLSLLILLIILILTILIIHLLFLLILRRVLILIILLILV